MAESLWQYVKKAHPARDSRVAGGGEQGAKLVGGGEDRGRRGKVGGEGG